MLTRHQSAAPCCYVQIEAGEGATAAIQQLEEQRKQLESRLSNTQSQATEQTAAFTQQLNQLQEQLAEEKTAAESVLQQLQAHAEQEQQLQQLVDDGKQAQSDLEQQLKVKVRYLDVLFMARESVQVHGCFT